MSLLLLLNGQAAPSGSGAGVVEGVGSLEGGGSAPVNGGGVIGGAGSLVGAGATVKAGGGNVDGVGSLSAQGSAPVGGSGSVDGVGSLVGEGSAPGGIPSGGGSVDGSGSLSGAGYTLRSGGGDIGGAGSLVGAGPTSISTRSDGGGSHGYSISDPRHPYWRSREELDEAQADPAAPHEHAQQRPTTVDRAAPATANPAPKSPGAEVVKALLGVPVPDVSERLATERAPPATAQESLPVPPKRRTPDVDEDVLLLLLID